MMQAQDFPLISHSPRRWAEFVRTRTPILESIVPLDSRGRRDWNSLRNEELAAYSVWRLAGEKINGKAELKGADSGLYQALRKRKLLDSVGLEEKQRDWTKMDNEGLIAFAKGVVEEKGIMGRGELARADSGDPGLYHALRKRRLLDSIGLGNSNAEDRDWAAMKNEVLVAFAKEFIASKGIGGRRGLERADMGLYQALRKRKLLDSIGLEEKQRDWTAMGDKELVAFAKEYIASEGIGGRRELQMADKGLYGALRKRKLLEDIGLEEKHRDWAVMGNKKLVTFAKEYIAVREIGGRRELEKADRGLYQALRKRKLLNAVFAGVEASKHADAVAGVLDALESFGDGK